MKKLFIMIATLLILNSVFAVTADDYENRIEKVLDTKERVDPFNLRLYDNDNIELDMLGPAVFVYFDSGQKPISIFMKYESADKAWEVLGKLIKDTRHWDHSNLSDILKIMEAEDVVPIESDTITVYTNVKFEDIKRG